MAEQFLSSRCDELESEVQELREQVEECMEYIQQHMTNVTMACEFRGSTTTPTWRQQTLSPTDCSLCENHGNSKLQSQSANDFPLINKPNRPIYYAAGFFGFCCFGFLICECGREPRIDLRGWVWDRKSVTDPVSRG